MISKFLFWGAYVAFVGVALHQVSTDVLLSFDGPLAGAKALVWAAYFAFLGYTIYCSNRENLFRSIAAIAKFHWGRQIGADLYLGLAFTLFVIYLHQGALVALLWLVPVLVYANLAILLYLGIHFSSLVARFVS